MTMIGIRDENERKALEAQTEQLRPSPEEEVPEAENFEELTKQPSTWLSHFAPVASLLHKGSMAAIQMLSTADTISEAPPLEPRIIAEPSIIAKTPQWGAAAVEEAADYRKSHFRKRILGDHHRFQALRLRQFNQLRSRPEIAKTKKFLSQNQKMSQKAAASVKARRIRRNNRRASG